MACIIYYQNLDYDQLPTARKRARLTPSLAGASNSFSVAPINTGPTSHFSTNTTTPFAPNYTPAAATTDNASNTYTNYTNPSRLGSLESNSSSSPDRASYSPPKTNGLARSPYFSKQPYDRSDAITFTSYSDQVKHTGGYSRAGQTRGCQAKTGPRGRRGRANAGRGAGGAKGGRAKVNTMLNDILGDSNYPDANYPSTKHRYQPQAPQQQQHYQPATNFKAAPEYGSFSTYRSADAGDFTTASSDPVTFSSDSQPLKQISPNTMPLANNYTTTANKNSTSVSYSSSSSSASAFQCSPRVYTPPDSATLHATLKKYFHFESFRTNQLEAVLATCQGLDTLILMPTGGGKSICYQLPAILSQGVTVVVSPLRSLIEDQVNRLKSLRIPTSALFGETSELEATNITTDLRTKNPKHKMLYVTPEKIGASGALTYLFNTMHSNGMLARFVIDEAHCVSMWGSDFRPDYRKLGKLRELWPDVPIMALTATAPPKVRDDIYNQLKMNQVTGKTFIQSFNRPNLKFEVRTKSKGCIVDICNLIRKSFKGQCGIIYCLSRNDCEQVAQNLRDQGITSAPYHAGLSDDQRKRVFHAWSSGAFQVVCATIAFGMGIDKSDVRFVVHYSVPKSVEGYYQEAGRAGRDGKFASCILYFSKSDLYRMRSMLSKGRSSTEDKNRDKTNLEHMISYVDNKNECRRSILLRYLGEQFNSSNCISQFRTACDNCLARNKSNSSYHDDDFIDDE